MGKVFFPLMSVERADFHKGQMTRGISVLIMAAAVGFMM